MIKNNSAVITAQTALETYYGYGEVISREFNSREEYQIIQAEAEEIRATIAAIVEPVRNARDEKTAELIASEIIRAIVSGEL